MNNAKLLAIKNSRRTVAVAIFADTRLEYSQLRHLSSVHEKAETSLIEFIHWTLSRFHIDHAALEPLPQADMSRRARINQITMLTLRNEAIPIWEIHFPDVLQAYGVPPLQTRRQLRSVVGSFWPIVERGADNDLILDAAAVGLYVQTERLFLNSM